METESRRRAVVHMGGTDLMKNETENRLRTLAIVEASIRRQPDTIPNDDDDAKFAEELRALVPLSDTHDVLLDLLAFAAVTVEALATEMGNIEPLEFLAMLRKSVMRESDAA